MYKKYLPSLQHFVSPFFPPGHLNGFQGSGASSGNDATAWVCRGNTSEGWSGQYIGQWMMNPSWNLMYRSNGKMKCILLLWLLSLKERYLQPQQLYKYCHPPNNSFLREHGQNGNWPGKPWEITTGAVVKTIQPIELLSFHVPLVSFTEHWLVYPAYWFPNPKKNHPNCMVHGPSFWALEALCSIPVRWQLTIPEAISCKPQRFLLVNQKKRAPKTVPGWQRKRGAPGVANVVQQDFHRGRWNPISNSSSDLMFLIPGKHGIVVIMRLCENGAGLGNKIDK